MTDDKESQRNIERGAQRNRERHIAKEEEERSESDSTTW